MSRLVPDASLRAVVIEVNRQLDRFEQINNRLDLLRSDQSEAVERIVALGQRIDSLGGTVGRALGRLDEVEAAFATAAQLGEAVAQIVHRTDVRTEDKADAVLDQPERAPVSNTHSGGSDCRDCCVAKGYRMAVAIVETQLARVKNEALPHGRSDTDRGGRIAALGNALDQLRSSGPAS